MAQSVSANRHCPMLPVDIASQTWENFSHCCAPQRQNLFTEKETESSGPGLERARISAVELTPNLPFTRRSAQESAGWFPPGPQCFHKP